MSGTKCANLLDLENILLRRASLLAKFDFDTAEHKPSEILVTKKMFEKNMITAQTMSQTMSFAYRYNFSALLKYSLI